MLLLAQQQYQEAQREDARECAAPRWLCQLMAGSYAEGARRCAAPVGCGEVAAAAAAAARAGTPRPAAASLSAPRTWAAWPSGQALGVGSGHRHELGLRGHALIRDQGEHVAAGRWKGGGKEGLAIGVAGR